MTNLPQKGKNLAIGETWVISRNLVNEFRFGYNYAYHLTSPISLDGRSWVGDIGLRNLAGAALSWTGMRDSTHGSAARLNSA